MALGIAGAMAISRYLEGLLLGITPLTFDIRCGFGDLRRHRYHSRFDAGAPGNQGRSTDRIAL
jgi:hypothetical protein